MKHIKAMSRVNPSPAAVWQDFLCWMVGVLNDILGAVGGNLPAVTYLNTKCENSGQIPDA